MDKVSGAERMETIRSGNKVTYIHVFPAQPGLIPVDEYARLSLVKRDAELQDLALERQSVRKALDGTGYYVARWVIDPDHSAFKRGLVRPGLDAILARIDSGETRGMVAYHPDRLTRRHMVGELILERYELDPSLYWYSEAPEIDPRTEAGRKLFRGAIEAAYAESLSMQRRQRKRHAQARAQGRTVVISKIFGWQWDPKDQSAALRLDPAEAALIREAAETVLAGRSTHPLMARWNEAGLQTVKGHRWTPERIRDILLNPRVAGYRAVHTVDGKAVRPFIARDENDLPIMGQQEPILDPDTWDAVCAKYAARAKLRKSAPTGKVKYFMSGILVCDKCGTRMGGGFRSEHCNGHVYVCPTHRGCGRVQINGPKTDAFFMAEVAHRLSLTPVEPVHAEPWPGQAELDELDGQIHQANEDRRARTITVAQWSNLVRQFEAVRAELAAERSAWVKDQPAPRSGTEELLTEWLRPALSPTARRDIVRTIWSAIPVNRPDVRRAPWSPDRFDLG